MRESEFLWGIIRPAAGIGSITMKLKDGSVKLLKAKNQEEEEEEEKEKGN